MLLIERAHLVVDQRGGLRRRGDAGPVLGRQAGNPATKFDGRQQRASLGRTDAGQSTQLRRHSALQSRQAADTLQEVLSDLDGASPAGAHAHQEGEQFGVAEGLRAECEESCAGPVLRGQVANAVGLIPVAHSPPFE